ncbi:MAG: hypothetical protein QX197_14465 [Methylococcaceae bacterium]
MKYNPDLQLSENLFSLFGKLTANQQSALTKQAKEALGITGKARGEDEQRRVFDWLAANKTAANKPSDSVTEAALPIKEVLNVLEAAPPIKEVLKVLETVINDDSIQRAISAGIAEGVKQALEALAIQKKPNITYTAIRVQDELIFAVKALKELYRKGVTAVEIIKVIENIKAG